MQRQIFINGFGTKYFCIGERARSPCHAELSCVNWYTLLAYILSYTNSYTNNHRIKPDLLGRLQTQKSPQGLCRAGFQDFTGRIRIIVWWSWRELNPRPKTLSSIDFIGYFQKSNFRVHCTCIFMSSQCPFSVVIIPLPLTISPAVSLQQLQAVLAALKCCRHSLSDTNRSA